MSPLPESKHTAPPSDGVHLNINELINLRHQAPRLARGARKKMSALLSGPHGSSIRGRGMDFEEVRAYLPGDDVRSIDWRVTARLDAPYTRVYREERERPVHIMVDFGPNMFFGTRCAFKTVIASRIAALLAWNTIAHSDRIGGILFNHELHQELRPKGAKRGILPLLHGLVTFTNRHPPAHISQHDWSTALQRLQRVARPGALVFLISDFLSLDAAAYRIIGEISRHTDCIAIQVLDNLEHKLPQQGQWLIKQQNENKTVDFRSKAQLQATHKKMTDWVQAPARQFRKQGIHVATLNTTDDLVDTLTREVFAQHSANTRKS